MTAGPLPLPPGDPAALRQLAAALTSVAEPVALVRRQTASAAASVRAGWLGPAGDTAVAGAEAVSAALEGTGAALVRLAAALDRHAWALEAAREATRRLQGGLDDADGLRGPDAAASRAVAQARVAARHDAVLGELRAEEASLRAAVAGTAASLPARGDALAAALAASLPVLRDHPAWVRTDLQAAALTPTAAPPTPAGRAAEWERAWSGA